MKRSDVSPASPAAAASSGARGWLERLVYGLMRRAARSAPPSVAERLEEEWLADLTERRESLSRLRFAAGCWWASRVIAHEMGLSVKAAAVASPSGKGVILYAQPHPFLLSPRATAFLLIFLLHALVVYVFAAGLGPRVVKEITEPFITSFLAPPRPVIDLPPPTTPKLLHPKVEDVPPPDIPIDPTDTAESQRVAVFVPQPALPPESPTKVANRVTGGPGPGFPNTEDYYPAASKRLGEKGIATIRVCVDAAGRLTADPTIAQSTGSARLDDGALKLARAGSGHYRATTEDGRAVSACYPYRIRFELRN